MLAAGAGVKKRTINCVARERNAIHFTILFCSGTSLRARGQLISPTEKELTTSSNGSRNQRHGVTLKVQLSKIGGLTIKKA